MLNWPWSATDATDEALLAERVRLLYKQIPTLHIGGALVTVITAVVLWDTVPRPLLMSWLIAMLALFAVRLLVVWRFFSRERSDADVVRWRYQIIVMAVAAGSMFGIGASLFIAYSETYQLIFITIVIVGVIAGGLVALSPYPPAYAPFAISTVLPFEVALLMRPDPDLNWISALMAIYLLAQLGHARHLSRMVSEWLRLRFENADLVERLREENERAEQAVVAKSRFLASASHDLRQPLHALGLFVEAQGRQRLPRQAEQLRQRMGASVDALGELINGLLDVSKLEAGTIESTSRPFALAPLFRRLKEEMAPAAKAKGLRLRLRAGGYWVISDRQHLERILRNLLDNAVKYTDAGAVLVVCRRRGERLAIEVRDSGIGVDAAAREHIFQEFYQADNPERDSAKGLGLGLAIVKGLAERLGHELEVQSAPGEGSVFRVLLPRGEAGALPANAVSANSRLDGLRVIIVDDDAAIRAGLASVLTGWGCLMAGYESAAECIDDDDRGWAPDVLLVDYRLREGRSGDAVVAELRAFFEREVPAFIITGETAPEPLRRMAAARLAVLHKPLRPARLRAALAGVRAAPLPQQRGLTAGSGQ